MTALFRQLIYTSYAQPGLTADALQAIVETSRRNNARAGITGILLHSGGQFMQVVEGPAAAVERLHSLIDTDPRHEGMRVVLSHDVAQRDFGQWQMAMRDLLPEQLARNPALCQFFAPDFNIGSLRYGTPATFLLQAFRELNSTPDAE